MDIQKYITEQVLVIIPVLYIIGGCIKSLENIKDKYIPLILMGLGIVFSMGVLGFNVQAVIQGVLVAGATVLGNQVVKQLNKE